MKVIETAIGVDEAAELIGRTPRRIQQMRKDGLLQAVSRGKYRLLDVVRAHLTLHEKETEAPASADFRTMRSEEVALRIQERSGRILAAARAETLAIVDEVAGTLKPDVMSVPARLISDLALRRRVEDALDECFDTAAQRADAASGAATPVLDVEGPGKGPSGRMGKGKSGLSTKRRAARAA